MLRVAKALERTKSCIVDARLMATTIANLEYQVKELELALSAIDTASHALEQIEAVRQSLDLRQKIRQWFKDRWKEFVAFILGVIAATEAAYIIYTTVTL